MMNASTIGLSDCVTVGVGSGVDAVGVEGLSVVVNGIKLGTRFVPSFVTYTGTSCPSIERITS